VRSLPDLSDITRLFPMRTIFVVEIKRPTTKSILKRTRERYAIARETFVPGIADKVRATKGPKCRTISLPLTRQAFPRAQLVPAKRLCMYH
jgi:hypothetical protein